MVLGLLYFMNSPGGACPVDANGYYVTFCTIPCTTHDGRVLQGLRVPWGLERAPEGSPVTFP